MPEQVWQEIREYIMPTVNISALVDSDDYVKNNMFEELYYAAEKYKGTA